MQGEKKKIYYYLRVLLRSILSDIVAGISSAKMPAAAGILQQLAPDATACCSFVIPIPIPHKGLSKGLSRRCASQAAGHKGLPPPSSTCLQPHTRNEWAPVGERGSCQGRQMYPRQAQQAEAPTERTGSDTFCLKAHDHHL